MTEWTLITGASEGIGKVFARKAAQDGHKLILTARSEGKLGALAEELRPLVEVVVIPADLSRMDEVERLWSEASRDRRINILINNAGLGSHDPFISGDWARELASINVNLLALTYLMKQAVPHMKSRGGKVLNVASIAGMTPGPNMAVYHASKAFVVSLTDSVAEELRGTAVTVTVLCPGPTDSNFFNDAGMQNIRLLKHGQVMPTQAVVDAGWTGMMHGKRIVVPGLLNKLFTFMPRFVPRALTSRIAAIIMAK